jgi:hypothetical protein
MITQQVIEKVGADIEIAQDSQDPFFQGYAAGKAMAVKILKLYFKG